MSMTYTLPNSVPVKMHAMTLQLRGMVRVVRDNRAAMLAEPEAVAELALASMQLAQIAKGLMEECE